MASRHAERSSGSGQPPHREVLAVQRRLQGVLSEAANGVGADSVLGALNRERSDDRAGLTELLDELGVDTPTALVRIVQLFTVSASTTALSWARGIPLDGADAVTAEDVVRTSWAEAEWEPAEGSAPPTGSGAG